MRVSVHSFIWVSDRSGFEGLPKEEKPPRKRIGVGSRFLMILTTNIPSEFIFTRFIEAKLN